MLLAFAVTLHRNQDFVYIQPAQECSQILDRRPESSSLGLNHLSADEDVAQPLGKFDWHSHCRPWHGEGEASMQVRCQSEGTERNICDARYAEVTIKGIYRGSINV